MKNASKLPDGMLKSNAEIRASLKEGKTIYRVCHFSKSIDKLTTSEILYCLNNRLFDFDYETTTFDRWFAFQNYWHAYAYLQRLQNE